MDTCLSYLGKKSYSFKLTDRRSTGPGTVVDGVEDENKKMSPTPSLSSSKDWSDIFSSIPTIWQYMSTEEHFRMASISKSLNDAVYSPIHLSTKGTCHQPEYWEMARRVRILNSSPQPYTEFYTRKNVARIIEATPIGRPGHNLDEEVIIFNTEEECNVDVMSRLKQKVDNEGYVEDASFAKNYFKYALPCWTWILDDPMVSVDGNHDENGLICASRIGGSRPAVYPNDDWCVVRGHDQLSSKEEALTKMIDDLGETEVGVNEDDVLFNWINQKYAFDDWGHYHFLFQVDLSTVPLRLQERVGGSGLLQVFCGFEDWTELHARVIPAADFPQMILPSIFASDYYSKMIQDHVKGCQNSSYKQKLVDFSSKEMPIIGWVERNDYPVTNLFTDQTDDRDDNEMEDYFDHGLDFIILEKFGGYCEDYISGTLLKDELIMEINTDHNLLAVNDGNGNMRLIGSVPKRILTFQQGYYH